MTPDLCAGTTRVSLCWPGRMNTAVSRAAFKPLFFFFLMLIYIAAAFLPPLCPGERQRERQGRERQGGR